MAKPDLKDYPCKWVCMTEENYKHIVKRLTYLHSEEDLKALAELRRGYQDVK